MCNPQEERPHTNLPFAFTPRGEGQQDVVSQQKAVTFRLEVSHQGLEGVSLRLLQKPAFRGVQQAFTSCLLTAPATSRQAHAQPGCLSLAPYYQQPLFLG